MARKEIGNSLDRENRNNHNDNYEELYRKITGIGSEIDDLVLNSGGDSNLEVVQARTDENGKRHTTLKRRIDDGFTKVTSQLNEKANNSVVIELEERKANKSDVESLIGGISEGTPLFADSIEDMTETNRLYVNTVDGYIYIHDGENFVSTGVLYQSQGIADESVLPIKTTFLKTSTNLFNKNKLIVGFNIDNLTGSLIESENTSVSEYIPCKPNQLYAYSRIAKFVWYDSAFNFIDPRSQPSPTLSYPNAHYMRVVIETRYREVAQINEGDTLLPYEDYRLYFKDDDNFVYERDLSNEVGRLVGDADKIRFSWYPGKLEVDNKATRIFYKNESVVIPGQSVDIPSSGWHKINYDFYEEKIKLIGSSAKNPLGNITIGFISGNKKTVIGIDNYYINGKDKNDIEDKENQLYYITSDIPKGWYKAPEVGGYESSSHYNDGITFNTVYNVFDRLVSENPEYALKENLGLDSTDTYPIYKYEFIPKTVESSLYDKKPPKVIIFTNTHGEEKSSTISLRNFMRDVCDNWENDELLEFIRFNVHLIIVPIVNPHGFVNYKRKNGNNVDINRNCSYRWETSDSPDPNATTYKGEAPFSEREAQYIRDIILSNKDAVACFDYHMNGGSGVKYEDHFWHYIENFKDEAGFDEINSISKTDISKLTRESHKSFDIPKTSGFIGYISYNNSSSTIAAYAFSEGIPSATIECTKKIVGEENVYSARTMRLCTEFIGNTIINTVREFLG